jgi:hypothetical protein
MLLSHPHVSHIAMLALGLSATLQIGCGPKKIEWREEVRLQDGEIILTKRTAKLLANSVAGGGGGSINEGMSLEVIRPIKPDNPGAWSARLVPMILDRDPDSKEWFIVATFFHCDTWQELGRPKLPYTEYRYTQGQWLRQSLSEKRLRMPANLFTSVSLENVKDLSVHEKDSLLKDPLISPEYRFVVQQWQHGC